MTYIPADPPHPLGQHRQTIDAIREQRGLTPAGWRQDGSDPAEADKKAALAELYRQADDHLRDFASALGTGAEEEPTPDEE